MTPQSNFMILAPVRVDARDELERLLAAMNEPDAPGMADPANAIFPFGRFETVHYARFVIIDDETLGDFAEIGLPVPEHPVQLAFLGECDGPAIDTLKAFAADGDAAAGLRQVFSQCEGFAEGADLVAWMRAHGQAPAAAYTNWLGRTVRKVRQEQTLYDALRGELVSLAGSGDTPRPDGEAVFRHLRAFAAEQPGLMPDDDRPTPRDWRIADIGHFLIVPAILIVPWLFALVWFPRFPTIFWLTVLPFLLIAALLCLFLLKRTNPAVALLSLPLSALAYYVFVFPIMLLPALLVVIVFLVVLRFHERREPEVIPGRPVAELDRHVERLAEREDHDVTNQFTVVGSLKPGWFRHWLARGLLWLIDYGARHVYRTGHLARIKTIHFARWTFIDNHRRLVFTSNYDGSLEAYMDDFINKVGWGLNLAFGCGFGYPRVNWLLAGGSKEEQKFKYTLRRHQMPTEVWYKAYPGLTAVDLMRNSRVHEGLKRADMSPGEIAVWLRDL